MLAQEYLKNRELEQAKDILQSPHPLSAPVLMRFHVSAFTGYRMVSLVVAKRSGEHRVKPPLEQKFQIILSENYIAIFHGRDTSLLITL